MPINWKEIFSVQRTALLLSLIFFAGAWYSGHTGKAIGAIIGAIAGLIFAILASSGLIARISANILGTSVSAETRPFSEEQPRINEVVLLNEPSPEEKIIIDNVSSISVTTEMPKELSESYNNPIAELFMAEGNSKSAIEFEEKYNIILNQAKFDSSRTKDEFKIIYYFLALSNGWSTDGIQKINSIASENEVVVSKAHYFKGLYFSQVSNYQQASREFLKAIELALDETERVSRVESYIKNCLKFSSPQELIPFLRDHITQVIGIDNHARLLFLLAMLYREMKEKVLATACEIKALALSPCIGENRFNIAYKTPENLVPLMALQYSILVSASNPDAMALNNLGALCQEHGMPIKGFKLYTRSSMTGNTLSDANIAYKYIEIGDVNTASKILERVKESENTHKNVKSAELAIITNQDNESEKWDELLSLGQKVQDFLISYLDKYFCNDNNSDLLNGLNGTWVTPRGKEILVAIENQSCLTKWSPNGILKMTAIGSSISGRYKERENTILSWAEDIDGEFIGFFDDNMMKIMMLDKDNKFYYFKKKEIS